MCGVVGLISHKSVNQRLYDSLIVMQHRGQDAAGIMTSDGKKLYSRRKNGMVNDVFLQKHMQQLIGNTGIGHVRYPTAGSSSVSQAQPFYVNSPYGIALAHNGNLTNSETLKQELYQQDRRQINTSSDSEVLLNVFAQELYKTGAYKIDAEHVFSAVEGVHKRCVGAYAVVAMLTRDGLVGFRDPNGIRPLVLGKRETKEGIDYMLASESVALLTQGYTLIRDIEPGEAVYIDNEFNLHFKQCSDNAQYNSCIFEYIYFARPDSVIDNVFVHKARMRMGIYLAERIEKHWDDIDVVVPIPDTSRTSAMEIAHSMNKPYREGFIKNRYIGRTFIMPGQKLRKKSVRQKLNPIDLEFRDKNVLLVDDSIVRGTTSKEIVQMARDSGAKKVYFASASPEIRHPNIYGIDMPDANELIAYNRTVEEVCDAIGADGLIFQSLDDLKRSITAGNESLVNFDCSVFNGQYVTDVSDDYFTALEQKRADAKKNPKTSMPGIDLSNTA